MHILITMSCLKVSVLFRINHFLLLLLLVCLFLVTASAKSVLSYVLKMFIIFAFCMISLPHSSRYVLIDISNLTHFLCRKLFVMSCLTSPANSEFRESFGNSLTITVIFSVQMVNAITNTL